MKVRTDTAVAAFFDAKRNYSERTLQSIIKPLTLLIDRCDYLPTERKQIAHILDEASTIWVKWQWWAYYCSFYTFCNKEYKTKNVMKLIEKPKVPEVEPRTLESYELAKLLAVTRNLQEECIIALGIDMGIRASEYKRIVWPDIGPDTILIHGKRDKHLRVPISPTALNILTQLAESKGCIGNSKPIFTGKDGKAISRFYIYDIVSGCFKRAGLAGKKMGSHCLRHSLGMNFIANGGDITQLKRILRHSRLTTTEVYSNMNLKQVKEAHRKYTPLHKAEALSQAEMIVNRTVKVDIEQLFHPGPEYDRTMDPTEYQAQQNTGLNHSVRTSDSIFDTEELLILNMLNQGISRKDIALKMHMREYIIGDLIRTGIFRKLRCNKVNDALYKAKKLGLVKSVVVP